VTALASPKGSASPESPAKKNMRKTAVKKDSSWNIEYQELTFFNQIGKGAFGVVHRGEWRGVSVAIKMTAIPDEPAKEELILEAKLMREIRPHKNITQFFGICPSPLCLVTEFVARGSLYDIIHSNEIIDEDTNFKIVEGIAAGMLHLHSEGIIHRDLAARNVLVKKNFNVKVADFGMSRIDLEQKELNVTNATTGPLKWMAPEALIDKVYTQKTDIWSFGVLIFEIIKRQLPYKDLDPTQTCIRIASKKISLLSYLKREEHPEVLVNLMERCLQYQPQERPSFADIVSELSKRKALGEHS